MAVHRNLDGSWAECPGADGCELLFHFPDATVAEMQRAPLAMLLPLFEAIQPPKVNDGLGKAWVDEDGLWHRDYDLPAVIRDGMLQYWRHGQPYRKGDLPDTILPDGTTRRRGESS